MDASLSTRANPGSHPEPGKEHFVHIAFGTPIFSQSLEMLRKSAVRWGVRDIHIYTPEHPTVRRAAEENPEIFAYPRGAGYWLWKPYILLDALESAPEGTLVVYTDAGIQYVGDPAPLIALAEGREIVLFGSVKRRLQSAWTKRDCFVLMNADTRAHWEQPQLDASVQIYRAGAPARQFLNELKLAMRDPRILTDQPNECGLPNFEDFRDHRHDQSILTILAMKHGIEPQHCPKRTVGGRSRRPGPSAVFAHHRIRNVAPIRHRWWQILETLGIRRYADRRRRKSGKRKS